MTELERDIIMDILKAIPTAFILESLGVASVEELMEEPIVRCKDCEYSGYNKYKDSLDCYHFAKQQIKEDDFCSHAKMKGDTE